jgi:hypothetical protein
VVAPAQLLQHGLQRGQVVQPAHGDADHLHRAGGLGVDVAPEQRPQRRVGLEQMAVEQRPGDLRDGLDLGPGGLDLLDVLRGHVGSLVG